MQSLGQQLRIAREARVHTLEQVHSRTRIPVKVLEAIEADDVDRIGSAFLYKSFVRQIAAELGLDYIALDEAVQRNISRIPAPLMPGQDRSSAPKVPALRVGRKKSSRLIYSLSSFALVVVACSAVYAAWQNAKTGLHASRVKVLSRTEAPPRVTETDNTASTFRVPGHDTTEQAGTPADVFGDRFTLELSATEPAWLSIIADGKQSFKGILATAQTKVLEGHSTARIRTGNAGGVKVVFNGKPLGALGARGQVRTVLFTKNNYEVLAQGQAHLASVDFNRIAGLKPPSLVPEWLPGS